MLKSRTRIAWIACGTAIALAAGLFESQAAAQCCGSAPAAVTYARPYTGMSWTSSYGHNPTCNPWVPGSCGHSVYRPVANYLPMATAYPSVATAAYTPYTAYSPGGCGANCVTTLQSRMVAGQPLRNFVRFVLPPWRPREVTTCYTPTAYSASYSACYPTSSAPACPTPCETCPTPCATCPTGCTSCPTPYYSASYDACNTCAAPACPTNCATEPCGTPACASPSTPSTYQENKPADSGPAMTPVPENSGPVRFNKPMKITPDERTAMQPIQRAVHYQPVSLTRTAAETVDTSGWRASRD